MDNELLQISERLLKVVAEALLRFETISEAEWNNKPLGKWSKKEILGHLIDSAANNHIRFIRAQLMEKEFIGLPYEQEFFAAGSHYQERNAGEIIELWKAYNTHLAYVIKHINPEKLSIICKIGDYEPMTFAFVVSDYVRHIEHHLGQIYSK